MDRTCNTHRKMRNAYKILAGISKARKPLGTIYLFMDGRLEINCVWTGCRWFRIWSSD
jgi:hypothetical protein